MPGSDPIDSTHVYMHPLASIHLHGWTGCSDRWPRGQINGTFNLTSTGGTIFDPVPTNTQGKSGSAS
jgi:hypothetical protein